MYDVIMTKKVFHIFLCHLLHGAWYDLVFFLLLFNFSLSSIDYMKAFENDSFWLNLVTFLDIYLGYWPCNVFVTTFYDLVIYYIMTIFRLLVNKVLLDVT